MKQYTVRLDRTKSFCGSSKYRVGLEIVSRSYQSGKIGRKKKKKEEFYIKEDTVTLTYCF